MKMMYQKECCKAKKEKLEFDFGINLRRLREANEMNQEDLAQLLHIKRQTISSYERGKSIPDIYMLIKIADVFAVSLDELVGRR
ncbi:MAG: helix-turn-helix transcriptional regulator [Ruminococcus sp.]|nr:helix-turn-helix transcriptional regulator [Ruminococcus sp.]